MVKRSFLISEIKNTVHWSYVINDLSGEEIIGGNYYEKELQKANQEKFRIEKVIKRKGNKLYIKWKGYDKIFSSWVDKKRHCKMNIYKRSQYFPKPFKPFGIDINVKADLSNYGTKTDLKNVTGFGTSKLAAKSHLVSLKVEVDKALPADLIKLSNVVNNDAVNGSVLKTKINQI